MVERIIFPGNCLVCLIVVNQSGEDSSSHKRNDRLVSALFSCLGKEESTLERNVPDSLTLLCKQCEKSTWEWKAMQIQAADCLQQCQDAKSALVRSILQANSQFEVEKSSSRSVIISTIVSEFNELRNKIFDGSDSRRRNSLSPASQQKQTDGNPQESGGDQSDEESLAPASYFHINDESVSDVTTKHKKEQVTGKRSPLKPTPKTKQVNSPCRSSARTKRVQDDVDGGEFENPKRSGGSTNKRMAASAGSDKEQSEGDKTPSKKTKGQPPKQSPIRPGSKSQRKVIEQSPRPQRSCPKNYKESSNSEDDSNSGTNRGRGPPAKKMQDLESGRVQEDHSSSPVDMNVGGSTGTPENYTNKSLIKLLVHTVSEGQSSLVTEARTFSNMVAELTSKLNETCTTLTTYTTQLENRTSRDAAEFQRIFGMLYATGQPSSPAKSPTGSSKTPDSSDKSKDAGI